MEWEEWKPWYDKIVSDFGFDPNEDERAATVLANLLEGRELTRFESLTNLIRGKEVIVFGPALFPGITHPENKVKVSAGSAIEHLTENGIRPDILVTDLDGDVRTQVKANRKGVIAVIHAHGDNIGEIQRWVPEFNGPLLGTAQVRAQNNVHNFGGFTDGDRAVFLAAHFGAKRIIINGFDFDMPVEKSGGDPVVKRKKLEYAKKLIDYAARQFDVEIEYEG